MIIVTNLIALFFHLFMRIIIIFSLFVMGFNSSAIRSENDHLARIALHKKNSWILFIIALVIYFILGLMIESNRKKLINFLSVSLTSIIGLIVLLIYYFHFKYIFGFDVDGMLDIHMIYSGFDIIYPTYDFYGISNIKVLIVNIIFVLSPSVFMWLGLETNKKFKNTNLVVALKELLVTIRTYRKN